MPTGHTTTGPTHDGPRTRRRRRAVAPALLLVVGLLLAGCSSSSGDNGASTTTSASGEKVSLTGVPGVSDDQIRFSAVGTNPSNPLGTCVLDCFLDGVNAYFDWRNSEGGIWGRQLVVSTVLDDELSKNQEQSLAIISANDTFATFSAPFVPTGWADLAAAGIPTYTLAINPPQAAGHPEIFGNNPVFCLGCTSRTAPYAVKLSGATKVASLGYGISENSKLCAEANAASVEKYSADIGGATVVYTNDALAFGLPNGIGPEVTAMKDAGVDFVLSCLDLNGMKTLAAELDRQGIRDQVTLMHANSYDQDYMASSGSAFEGDYVQVAFRPFEADPGVEPAEHLRGVDGQVGQALVRALHDRLDQRRPRLPGPPDRRSGVQPPEGDRRHQRAHVVHRRWARGPRSTGAASTTPRPRTTSSPTGRRRSAWRWCR